MRLDTQVEGEWGEFTIKMVEVSDIPAILDHLTHNFHQDEPVRALCPPDDKFPDFANRMVAKLVQANTHLCFIALHKSTNEIAGCQLQFKWTKYEAEHGIAPQYGLAEEDIPPTRKLINKVMAPFDAPKHEMFERFGVDAVAWNFVASTAKDFRGKGLASEMYRRMVILLRSQNLKLAFSIFTSLFTRRIAEKMGFEEIARVYLATVLDESGNQVLRKARADDMMTLMALPIN